MTGDDDPWQSWYAKWRPLPRPDTRAGEDDFDACLLEILNPAHCALIRERAGEQAEHLWTMLDGGGLSLVICPGNHVVNRIAYILTEKAHAGCGTTPPLVLGDPEISVVPDEMTEDELRDALDTYEEWALEDGEDGRIAARNLKMLQEEQARRRGRQS